MGEKEKESPASSRGGISWVSHMDTECWRRCKRTAKEGRTHAVGENGSPWRNLRGKILGSVPKVQFQASNLPSVFSVISL